MEEDDPHPPMRSCDCEDCALYFDRKDESPADGILYENKCADECQHIVNLISPLQ